MLELGRHLYALLFRICRLLIRRSRIDAVLSTLIRIHECVITEYKVLRLLAYIEESDITQRLVYLTPCAVVVVEDRVILRAGDLIALTLLVLSCDIGVQRLQVQILAQLRSDLISQDIQLRLAELTRLPMLHRYHILCLHLLHLRLRLSAYHLLSTEMRRELSCYPVYGLSKTQMLLTLYQLYGRVCLVIRATLILQEPHTILLKNSGRWVTVILPDLEVFTAATKTCRCLRIVMHDDRLTSFSGQKNIILLNHSMQSS